MNRDPVRAPSAGDPWQWCTCGVIPHRAECPRPEVLRLRELYEGCRDELDATRQRNGALIAERDRVHDELADARADTALLVRVFGRIAPWRVTGRDVCDLCRAECNPAIGCRHAGAR